MTREMIYAESKYREPLLLEHDWYRNYEFFILNLGTHPTAYVVLEEENKLFGKGMDELDCIDCHYGITYAESYLTQQRNYYHDNLYYVRDKWVIGWDYAHLGDFTGYLSPAEIRFYSSNMEGLKKWTTEEIIQEVKHVIRQIKRVN